MFFYLPLIAAVGLWAAQMIPVIGFILGTLGIGFLAGLLVHLAVVLLAVDAIRIKRMRPLLVVPALAYVYYYTEVVADKQALDLATVQLKADNARAVTSFNTNDMSLVASNAKTLVAEYDLPIAFSESSSSPVGYISYRLLPISQCATVSKNNLDPVHASFVSFQSLSQGGCVLVMPEKPPHRIVVVKNPDMPDLIFWQHNIFRSTPRVQTLSTEILRDGVVISSYKEAYAKRLSLFPGLFLGCQPELRGQGDCGVALARETEQLDTRPDDWPATRSDNLAAHLLGIKKRDIESFKNPLREGGAQMPDNVDEENAARRASEITTQREAIEKAMAERKRRLRDPFAILEDILAGDTLQPWLDDVDKMTADPERLSPYASALAARFDELVHESPNEQYRYIPPHRFVRRASPFQVVASVIGALPDKAFKTIARPVFNTLSLGSNGMYRDLALWLRAADAEGEDVFAYYKDRFLHNYLRDQIAAAVALCRRGEADAEVIAAMKERFASGYGKRFASPDEDRYVETLFVALLRFGAEDFVRPRIFNIDPRNWFNTVLDGKGKTARGPNNCFPEQSPGGEPLPPTLGPTLALIDGHWMEPVTP